MRLAGASFRAPCAAALSRCGGTRQAVAQTVPGTLADGSRPTGGALHTCGGRTRKHGLEETDAFFDLPGGIPGPKNRTWGTRQMQVLRLR